MTASALTTLRKHRPPTAAFVTPLVATAIIGLSWSVAAQAQTDARPSLPGPAEQGLQQNAAPAPEIPEFNFSVEIPEGQQPPPGGENDVVDFTNAVIEGSTVFKAADFEKILAPLRGKEITLAELFGLTGQIDNMYREAGYTITFAYVPAQEVADGVYQIAVVEGFVEDITVDGMSGAQAETIKAQLQSIKGEKPLRTATLEKYLLLINQLPGTSAQGILRPAKALGGSELTIKVDRKPFTTQTRVDNRGSKFAGPYRALHSFTANSPLGLGERIGWSFGVANPVKEQSFQSLDLAFPVWRYGTNLVGNINRSTSRPGFTLDSLDVQSRGNGGSLGLVHPFFKTRKYSLDGSVTFAAKNSATDIAGVGLSRDFIRTFTAGVQGTYVGLFGGATSMGVRVVQGLDVFDASDEGTGQLSRNDADAIFTKFAGEFSHQQPIYGPFSAAFGIGWQASKNALVSSEEFALGGQAFGRGYDAGEILGEDGIGAFIELRANVPVRDWVPAAYKKWADPIQALQVYSYYDGGVTWDKGIDNGQRTLESAGGGARLQLPLGIAFDLEVAQPLTRAPGTGKDKLPPKVLLGLTYSF